MPVVWLWGQANHITHKLLTIQAVRMNICAGVFPKLPSSPATLWKQSPELQCARWKWEFSPVARLLQARIKVLLAFCSTNCALHGTHCCFYFSFFIGILVPICVHVIITVEVPQSLHRETWQRASFVGVRWWLLALYSTLPKVFRKMALYVEGFIRSGMTWKLCCIAEKSRNSDWFN